MSREIKFRVWDSKECRFIEWYNADPMIACNTGTVFCHERTMNKDGSYGADKLTSLRHHSGVLTVQQYTGLKDKNGKEIYEGDIIQLPLTSLFRSRITTVRYEGNRFWPDDLAEDLSDIIVIGNIFETPELKSDHE
jgi:uncharacterized phage protein (TIGR01671 family)